MVNEKAWAALPAEFKTIFEVACNEQTLAMLAHYDATKPRRAETAGSRRRQALFLRDVMDAAYKASQELWKELSASNPTSRRSSRNGKPSSASRSSGSAWPKPHWTTTLSTPSRAADPDTMDLSENAKVKASAQGIGARVPRKEDARHLAGKGNFVGDMAAGLLRGGLPAQPLGPCADPGRQRACRDRRDGDRQAGHAGCQGHRGGLHAADHQESAQPPLASGKVRFVGEPVAMAFKANPGAG